MKISTLLLSLSVLLVSAPAFADRCTENSHAVLVDSNLVPQNTIIISRKERALYFGCGGNFALRYQVGVPLNQADKSWFGVNYIDRKAPAPAWEAPDLVVKDHPEFSGKVIPGGASNNPMGAYAMVLRYHEAAIHGTTAKMRKSIGTEASYGCIRMRNEDVLDLQWYVREGDRVCLGHDVNDALAMCH